MPRIVSACNAAKKIRISPVTNPRSWGSWPAARAGLMNQVVRKDSQKALAHTPSAKSMTADTASTTVSATIIRSFLLNARRPGEHVGGTHPRTTPAHGVQYSCSHNLLQVSDFRRFGARRGSPE